MTNKQAYQSNDFRETLIKCVCGVDPNKNDAHAIIRVPPGQRADEINGSQVLKGNQHFMKNSRFRRLDLENVNEFSL